MDHGQDNGCLRTVMLPLQEGASDQLFLGIGSDGSDAVVSGWKKTAHLQAVRHSGVWLLMPHTAVRRLARQCKGERCDLPRTHENQVISREHCERHS